VKIGRTEMQDAVPTTLGRSMGAYADLLGRDRWRLSKCAERLRVVNLGGTAIGTGLGAPRRFVFAASDALREITGLRLARAENLLDATQNQDALVEVSGLLRTFAVSLVKICGDLRLLSSGPEAGLGELSLPARQEGSSIMPDKVNPVVPEAVTQAALRVVAHDASIAQAGTLASLELHPFLPLVADALLESAELSERAARLLAELVVGGLEARPERCRAHVEGSTALATALVPALGHALAAELARQAREEGRGVRAVVLDRGLLTSEELDALLSPEALSRLGHPETAP
jgi:aspartate ammonia-lyase